MMICRPRRIPPGANVALTTMTATTISRRIRVNGTDLQVQVDGPEGAPRRIEQLVRDFLSAD